MLFDTVVALALLEHLPDPLFALPAWAEAVTPDGRLVITTPQNQFHSEHELGALLGVFSRSGADEHEEMFDRVRLHQCGIHLA